ncbi:MAG: hypothetical protein PHW79_03160 [Candidatus Marinimicrobia bacterium]|nr:hypothetical protein [Candidatus Neomarinimicrobiota bacterium]
MNRKEMKKGRQSFLIKILLIAGFISISSEAVFSQSSPPLLIDDTGTPGSGNWEINILTSLEHSKVNDEWQLPLFDINYGLGESGQLTVGLPYVVDRDKDLKIRNGFDGMEIGFKYRFVDNPSGSNFSSCPTVYFSFENGDNSEFILPVEWHREWSHFGLTAEAGHIWIQGQSENWEGGVGAAMYLDNFEILGELHSAVEEAPFDLSEPMLNLGLTWEWSESISAYFSIGKSLHSHDEEMNLWSLAGIQLFL